MQLFKNPKEIKSVQRNDTVKLPQKYPMKYVVKSTENLPGKFGLIQLLQYRIIQFVQRKQGRGK